LPIISSDRKFSKYRKYGLDFIPNYWIILQVTIGKPSIQNGLPIFLCLNF
jgi:hypothetical protein